MFIPRDGWLRMGWGCGWRKCGVDAQVHYSKSQHWWYGMLSGPILLMLSRNKISQMKTQVAVIPGGLTSQLQPLDVSINKPFKCFIREEWNKWMQEECEVTPTGRRKRPSIGMVCEWVKKVWDQINTEIVIKSFKKWGISNALEDDILFEESGESNQVNYQIFLVLVIMNQK